MYLAVTLDRFSRRVVGWQLSQTLETPLVTEALTRAQRERRPRPGLLHHSDRGIQYASSACYDNALVESFFATLKAECLADQQPLTPQQAQLMIFDYIETFYNPKRLHSALGFKSPVDFEKQFH